MSGKLPDILIDKSQIYYHTDIVINYAELLHSFDYRLRISEIYYRSNEVGRLRSTRERVKSNLDKNLVGK